jgi:xanthine dehydrogenase accessory factor
LPVREITEALLEVLASGQRGALATVVSVRGSTPQAPGARLLLRPDGTTVGTVGGGAIELVVLEALARAQKTGQSELLSRALGYDLGMCCGGHMDVFVEPVEGAPRLWIFGAGHVAKALAPVARGADFDVHVVDEREELNSEERFPNCRRIVVDAAECLAKEAFGERDWLVIVTHDHRLDERALELALQKQARYIGLVASRAKLFRIVDRIRTRTGQELDMERVYCPIGLDIGAVGPQEIAISVVAELVALRRGHAAQRGEPVHLRAVDEIPERAASARRGFRS